MTTFKSMDGRDRFVIKPDADGVRFKGPESEALTDELIEKMRPVLEEAGARTAFELDDLRKKYSDLALNLTRHWMDLVRFVQSNQSYESTSENRETLNRLLNALGSEIRAASIFSASLNLPAGRPPRDRM